MSHRGIAWAWKQPVKRMGQRVVLLALGEMHGSSDGQCFPSLGTLVGMTVTSKRSLIEILRQLEADGLIKIKAGGGRLSNRYTLVGIESVAVPTVEPQGDSVAVPPMEPQADTPADRSGSTVVTAAGDFSVRSGSTGVTRTGAPGISPKECPAAPDPASSSKQKTSGTEAAQVIDHLNAIAGSRFKVSPTSTRWINGRLHDGHTVGDLLAVVDFKARDWLGDPAMRQYLRPATLFRPGKFEAYLAAARSSGRSEHPAVAAERLRRQREAEAAANPDRRECENCSGGGCLVCCHRGWHPAKAVDRASNPLREVR